MAKKRGSSGLGSAFREVGPYLSLGVEFAASILICLAVGWWADRRFQTSPWLTLFGAFFGMAAGFVNLYRTASGIQKRDRQDPGPGDGNG